MAGQNILQKLNAARGRAPVGAAGGGIRLGALLGGPVTAAYAIPGFGEQRARNQQDVLSMAKGPLNELQYIGSQLLKGRNPYARVGSIPPSANGESYRDAELRLSAAARAAGGPSAGGGIGGGNAASFIPYAGGSGGFSPAAERAYQTEKSRVAQLTAQDPELQRYENVIQRTLGAGQMGSPMNLPFDTSSPLGTTPPVPTVSYDAGKVAQGIGLSPVPRNAFAGASASPYAAFSQGPTLQSAPLGVPSEMPSASYEGVTGIQPMGSAVDKFDPKGAEAQKLLEMYKNAIFSGQK